MPQKHIKDSINIYINIGREHHQMSNVVSGKLVCYLATSVWDMQKYGWQVQRR